MNKKNKLKMVDYYLSKECYCGEGKKGGWWMCAACTRVGMSLPQSEVADKACSEHFKQIIRWINQIKRAKAKEKIHE